MFNDFYNILTRQSDARIFCCRNGYERGGSIHDAEKAPEDIPRRRLDLKFKKKTLENR